MAITRTQHGRDELVRLAVEDEQRVVHVLAVVPVVGAAFLLPVGRIIRAVEVEHDVGGHAVPLPLAQVDLPQGQGQAVAALAIDGVLQARQRRLAGQVGPGLGQAATDQLQQRVGAQGVGVVLVLVAAGDLEDALADQCRQGVAHRAAPPLGNHRGEGGAQPDGQLRLLQPRQPAVGGQPPGVELDLQRQRGRTEKAIDGCGRLRHAGASWVGIGSAPHPYQKRRPAVTSHAHE